MDAPTLGELARLVLDSCQFSVELVGRRWDGGEPEMDKRWMYFALLPPAPTAVTATFTAPY
jgi:hypothetical protein